VSRRQQRLVGAQVVLLVVVVAVAVLDSDAADWRPLELFASLFALAVAGEFVSVRTGRIHIGPAFLAAALAWSLLGAAPAALIAVTAVSLWSLRNRTPPDLFLNNVVSHATCPVVGGLLIDALRDPTPATQADPVVAAVVFAVYLPVNLLEFVLVVGYLCLRDGGSFRDAYRRLYRPVVPWEITTAAVVAGTVLAYQELELVAIGLLAILLATQSSLLRAVLAVERQRDELRELVDELVGLQRGVVRVLVETLSLRDQMTARHSAAVARFARATAQAAGLPEREQELVRIAGLLHDVGKFTFPDRTLTSRTLSDEDWALIRSHPQRGADIVRRVRGYGEVADVILCHHERVDGRGYPRGLAGEDIPVLARIISIADTFDVMTARDSYRTPVTVPEALQELRRVAGAQLDADLVDVFVTMIEGGRVGFAHADDADLEEELTYERREGTPAGRRRLGRRSAPAAAASRAAGSDSAAAASHGAAGSSS